MPSSEDSVSVHKYVCKSWTNSLESCWINGIWIQTYTLIQAEQVFILFYSFINSSTIMFDTCMCMQSKHWNLLSVTLCTLFLPRVCVRTCYWLHVCFPQAAVRGQKGEKGEPAVLEPVSQFNSFTWPGVLGGGGGVLPEATGNCTGNLPLTILLFTVIQEIHSPIILLGAACYSQFGLP